MVEPAAIVVVALQPLEAPMPILRSAVVPEVPKESYEVFVTQATVVVELMIGELAMV
jgi:hypothetical protein